MLHKIKKMKVLLYQNVYWYLQLCIRIGWELKKCVSAHHYKEPQISCANEHLCGGGKLKRAKVDKEQRKRMNENLSA